MHISNRETCSFDFLFRFQQEKETEKNKKGENIYGRL
jgi:hypothetical protein